MCSFIDEFLSKKKVFNNDKKMNCNWLKINNLN